MGFTQAAEKFTIPRSTLKDRYQKMMLYNTGGVPRKPDHMNPKIGKDVEKEIVSAVAKAGTMIGGLKLRAIAASIAIQKGQPFKNGLPSKPWVNKFKERNPEIKKWLKTMKGNTLHNVDHGNCCECKNAIETAEAKQCAVCSLFSHKDCCNSSEGEDVFICSPCISADT